MKIDIPVHYCVSFYYYFSITEKLSICASALLLLLRVTMMDRKRTLELTLFLSLRHQTNKFWAPKWQQKPWSNQTFWFKAFWDESRGAAVSVVISDKMRHARSPSGTKWFIRPWPKYAHTNTFPKYVCTKWEEIIALIFLAHYSKNLGLKFDLSLTLKRFI